MQKLKFATGDAGTAFYRDLNVALKEHFNNTGKPRHGGRHLALKATFYTLAMLSMYGLMLTSTSVLLFYAFYLIAGLFVLLIAFNVSHDAAHGIAVKSKWGNKLLFQLSFNLQGNNAYIWGKNHNESHHLYTNVEGSDIDVLNNPLVRMTTSKPLRWFHKYQFFYVPFLYLLYSLNWFLFREALMLIGKGSRTIKVTMPRSEALKLVVLKLAYLGFMIAIPAMFTPFGWGSAILAFLLNHALVSIIFVGVLGVSHLNDFVHHPEADNDGALNMSWPTLQLLTSVDYNVDSKFFNFTLGGFNAHALHHLLPNVSHVHYLDIAPIFRALAVKHNLPYLEMNYRNALASHFRQLYRMGREEAPSPKPYLRGDGKVMEYVPSANLQVSLS